LKLCVFGFGFFEDGEVRVGVSPEREEFRIGRTGLGRLTLHGACSADLEIRECSDGLDDHNPAMVEDFLEFSGGFAALTRCQISFSAHKDGVQGGQG
jgi:hypothetical protein